MSSRCYTELFEIALIFWPSVLQTAHCKKKITCFSVLQSLFIFKVIEFSNSETNLTLNLRLFCTKELFFSQICLTVYSSIPLFLSCELYAPYFPDMSLFSLCKAFSILKFLFDKK